MEVPSSPTSVVVNSPRRTLSLVRRDRRAAVWLPPTAPPDEGPSPARAGPNPTEVYGFVGSITTVIATAVYLVWAYTPEPWLHSLGITYYPNKYWALAVPAFAMVTVTLVMVFYLGLNFMVTAPPTSLNTIFDLLFLFQMNIVGRSLCSHRQRKEKSSLSSPFPTLESTK